MRADMTSKITIKQYSTTPNEYGEFDGAWTTVVSSVFASLEPILGNEYFSAEKIQSDISVKFRTYYVSGVTKAMRVYCGTDIYEIVSAINPKNQNRELLLYCKRI